uniref:C-type lectin domain-containing protein n=1 Tax=Salvator merianae TaxID=96440 RepID=A0A8D0ATX5_SALMN
MPWPLPEVATGLRCHPLPSSLLGLCPPKWILYRDELCLYFPASPALSWNESRVFCQDQNADLVVIKDYSKQVRDEFAGCGLKAISQERKAMSLPA